MKSFRSTKMGSGLAIMALIAACIICSCQSAPTPVPSTPMIKIESVRLSLTKLNSDLSPSTEVVVVDYDSEGHATTTSIHLEAGRTYRLQMALKGPGGSDANAEISAQGKEHQFFFFALPSEGIADYTYNDVDSNGRGIGLDGNITLSTINTALSIVLRHELDKSRPSAQEYNNPDYEEAGGSENLRISLNIEVL